jgi:hypothetical protein
MQHLIVLDKGAFVFFLETGSHYVGQACLDLCSLGGLASLNPSISASGVLGLQMYTTTSSQRSL